jgi:4-amino-4-deoxy-L-arabinose transferase-like glycosyltransferase
MTALVFREGTEPVAKRVVTSLDPEQLATAAGLDPQRPFEVEWQGLLVAEEAGTHRLRVRADDGVAMWVGDEQILDERDHVGEQHVTAPVGLAEGLHKFRLRYVQRGGVSLIRLSWARPYSREEFHPVPIVLETDPPPLYRRMAKADRYPRQVAAAWSVWLLVGLAFGGIWLVESVAGTRLLEVMSGPQAIAVLLVSGVALGANLQIGLLPFRGWAPDEVMPRDVYFAGARRFTGGWYHQYPPLPFYLLSLVNAPFTTLERFARLSFGDPVVYQLVHLVDRGVVLAFAVLTCIAMPLVAARTAGPRAAALAPYCLMGVPIVAFYSKTTNVDAIYAFWVVVAALAFVRAVTSRTAASHAWLGMAAAAAVASKDQAYGFFPGAAFVLLWMAWRQAPGRSHERIARTLTDRPLWTGLLTFAALYSLLLGIWWNPVGVREHFNVITGQASTPFRMFPRTVAGTAELAGTTLMLLGLSVGPVVALAAILGIGVSASERQSRPALLLAAMPLGYFVTFLGVVGYVYDRFLLAAVPFVVLLAVRGIEWALEHVRNTSWQGAARALILAACLYPAVATNARLAWDSRFGVESWMRENLTQDPSVLAVGSALYLPNLYPYQHRVVPSASIREILSWDADVLVLNEDWLERPGQPSDETIDRELGGAGYRKAYATGRTPPPGGLGGLLASGLTIDPLYSNIAKTSPPISIWVRPATNESLGGTGAAAPELGPPWVTP